MNSYGAWVVGLPSMVILALSACTDQDELTRSVRDHEFSIPRKYLVDSTIFFLPASQNRGLRFVINPNAMQNHQILVSIDPQNPCPAKIDGFEKGARCHAVAISTASFENDQLARVTGDNKVWWEYRSKRTNAQIAACTALVGEPDGLCMSYGLYEGLPYTVHFRDSQIGKLVEIRKDVERSLTKWEIR